MFIYVRACVRVSAEVFHREHFNFNIQRSLLLLFLFLVNIPERPKCLTFCSKIMNILYEMRECVCIKTAVLNNDVLKFAALLTLLFASFKCRHLSVLFPPCDSLCFTETKKK